MEEFNSDNEKIDRILEEHATALENKLNRKLLYRYTVETAETIVILGQKWVRGCNIRRGLVRCNPALQSTLSILIPQMA